MCNKFLKNSFEELLAKKFADYCYEANTREKGRAKRIKTFVQMLFLVKNRGEE